MIYMPRLLKWCHRGLKCLDPDGPYLPMSSFPPHNTARDGLQSQCRMCRNAANKLWKETGTSSEKTPYYVPEGHKCCARRERCLHPQGPVLPLGEFGRHSGSSDGLRCWCKACQNAKDHLRWANNPEKESARSKDYRRRNREKLRAYRRFYYQRNRDRERQWTYSWARRHPDRIHQIARKTAQKHGEKRRERGRRHYRLNREKYYIAGERRRSRFNSLPATFTETDWKRCLEYWHYQCAVCGRPIGFFHTLAQDHWIPNSDPRPDNPGYVPANIVPLCHGVEGCNNSKGDKDPEIWLTQRFGQRKGREILKRVQAYFAWLQNLAD